MTDGSTKILAGQKALVTGANSGIGEAVAIALGQAGADVVVNYRDRGGARRGGGRGNPPLGGAGLRASGGRLARRPGAGDVRAPVAEFGTLDILVNNAGLQRDAPFHAMTLAAMEHGHRRQPDRPVPVRPRGGARVPAPRRRPGGLPRGRQDHLHQLGAPDHPVGRARQLRRLQGRRHDDDENPRPGGRAAAHPGQRHRPGAIRTPINTAAWSTPEAYRQLMTLVPYKRIGEPEDIGEAVGLARFRRFRLRRRRHLVRRRRHDALSRFRRGRLRRARRRRGRAAPGAGRGS